MNPALAATPPEVLDNITKYLGGVSILRLWSTGNIRLRNSISAAGGVTEIVLQDVAKRSISKYPNILDNLTQITKLSINRGSGHLCEAKALWNHLSKLVHLRSLLLKCIEAELWLVEDKQVDPSLSTEVSTNRDRSRLKSFATTFVHLETLGLHPVNSQLIDSDVAYFPPSITSLDLSSQSDISVNCLKHFPGECLLSLKVGFDILVDSETIEILPRSLTSLIGTSRTLWDLTSKANFPDLQVLKVNGRNIAVEYLPNSLRYFAWQFRIAQPNLGISELPFTQLKKLVISDLRGSLSLEEVPKFPASLEILILYLPITKPLDPNRRLALPPRLQHLTLGLCDINGFFEDQLPSTLVEFDFSPHRDSGRLELLSVPLPPSLTSLSISKFYHRIPSGHIELFETLLLPHKLTNLSVLKNHHFTVDQLALIPGTVTKLAISIFDHAENCIRLLPSKLLSLDLKFNSTISLTTEDMKHLSPHIVHLSLQPTLPENLVFDEDRIKLLPPNLTRLALRASGLTDDAVQLLPRSIIDFSYQGDSLLTGHCFAFLPRELRRLSLPTVVSAKDEDLKDLPPYLNSLHLGRNISLTLSCLAYLPRSLLFFECSAELEAAFEAFVASTNQGQ